MSIALDCGTTGVKLGSHRSYIFEVRTGLSSKPYHHLQPSVQLSRQHLGTIRRANLSCSVATKPPAATQPPIPADFASTKAADTPSLPNAEDVLNAVLPSTTAVDNKPLGWAALFGVALLWGSYTPALRYLFLSDEPPSPALINAAQACLSSVFLFSALLLQNLRSKPDQSNNKVEVKHHDHLHEFEPFLLLETAMEEVTENRSQQQSIPDTAASDAALRVPGTSIGKLIVSALNWRSTQLHVAGAEVGLWTFLAFGLEVLGVQLTSATKAAFLLQATVLITPLLVYLSGAKVQRAEWIACAMGVVGSALVAMDGFEAHATGGGDESGLGHLFVLASALFFALSTVRLGRYSTQFRSLNLSCSATFFLAMLSLIWVAATAAGDPRGFAPQAEMLHELTSDPSHLLMVLYLGLGPGAMAAFLQATGQQYVPPAQAQVIYSTTPLWSAALAYTVLQAHDESMGLIAWGGAALMLASSVVASTAAEPASEGAA